MRVYSIILWDPQLKVQISELVNLEDFSFWQKSTVLDIIREVSRLTIGLTVLGKQTSVVHEGYLCHVMHRKDGLAGAIITDEEYPSRVAFDLLHDYSDKYFQKYGLKACKETFLPEYIIKIQNPEDIDKLMKIKKDIDETREVVLETIEQLINRGEKLENLEHRTDELLREAKKFKTQTEDLNSCCIIL